MTDFPTDEELDWLEREIKTRWLTTAETRTLIAAARDRNRLSVASDELARERDSWRERVIGIAIERDEARKELARVNTDFRMLEKAMALNGDVGRLELRLAQREKMLALCRAEAQRLREVIKYKEHLIAQLRNRIDDDWNEVTPT